MKRILVVGGGASGMASAYAASAAGHEVTLLEKNEKLGKKVFITGKGRCNVTNDADTETFFNAVVRNPRFLYSAFHAFSNQDLKAFLEREGCPLKTERGQRVFPVSDHASDVIRAWERALRREGVQVLLNTEVTRLSVSGDAVSGVHARTKGGEERFYGADTVILATGGISYPATGSTGDGFRFAKTLGLSVTDPLPSLVPFETKESWPKALSGLTLKNVAVKCFRENEKKPLYEDFGELLFTNFGVSGPVILSASTVLTEPLSKGERILMTIDLKPALSAETLDERLLRDLNAAINQKARHVFRGLLPASLLETVFSLAGIDPDKPGNTFSKAERAALVHILKALPLTVEKTRGAEEAVVTRGGIDVKEIDPKTMRVRKYQNLYAAGELIDVDAKTGGFNLQIAWSTGILAGRNS